MHPVFSAFHALAFLGYAYLGYRLRWSLLGAYSALTCVEYLTWVTAFLSSPHAQPLWYWVTFWTLEFGTSAIALTYAIRYGVRHCRHFRIGRGNAGIVMGALFALALGLMLLRDGQPSALLQVNHAVRFGVCGVVILMLVVCGGGDGLGKSAARLVRADGSIRSRYLRDKYGVGHQARETSIMNGFAALYLAGLITSALLAYKPMTREAAWAVDLTVQLSVISWWIWKV